MLPCAGHVHLRPNGKDTDPLDGHHPAQYTKAGIDLSPATREERCCHKCKECRFQAFPLSPGACTHPKKKESSLLSRDMRCVQVQRKEQSALFVKASHHRTVQKYSSGQCTLGGLHTLWRTRLLGMKRNWKRVGLDVHVAIRNCLLTSDAKLWVC